METQENRIAHLGKWVTICTLFLLVLLAGARTGMAADDFVIIADQSSVLYYARSNGDGTFSDYEKIGQAYVASGYTRGIAMNDFNNDGHMDFVVGRGISTIAYYFLFLNDGNNKFTMTGEVGTLSNANSHAMDMATGDFNNDGNMDFIANGNYWNTGLYLGDGKGHFSKTEMNLGNYGRGMDVADFNNDGNLDFARANYSNGYIYIHPGNGDGTFAAAILVGDSGDDPYGLAAGDFNNDGFADIMVNSGGGGDPYFFAGNGDNTFVDGVYQVSLDVGQHGAYDAYDYDGDGNLDVVATLYSARELRFYKGIGDGTFAAHVVIGTTANELWAVSAPPIGASVNVPKALISPSSAAIVEGAAVDFDGSGSTDSDGTIASWVWAFGDDSADEVENPDAHIYTDEGTYVASLKVTDNDSKVGRALARVVVSGDAPVVDTAKVSFGEDKADHGIWTVALNGADYASDAENNIISYAWDFGTITDDFEDQNIDDWTIYAGTWAVSDENPITGVYAFHQSHATLDRTQVLNNREYYGENTVIQADVTLVSGTGEEVHLLFRGRDDHNNYEFILRGRGQNDTLLYRRVNNSASNLLEYDLPSGSWWTGDTEDNPYPIDVGHTYHLKIVLTGALMQFYLDGHFLFSYSDATFPNGRVGFSTYDTVAVFDNLSVRETAAGQNVTRRFGPARTYDVGLNVTDGAGQTDTGTIAMTMAPGALPVAKAGGPYHADETDANGGGWTFDLVDGGSSDDVEIQMRTWEFGNDTFDGEIFQDYKWFSNGNVSQSDAIAVTGVSTWDTRYLVSRATYPKVKDQIFQARIKATSGQSMLGFKNTSTTNFYYTQFPYCFYLYNGSVYIYENSNSRGDAGYDYAYDTWYDFKIELKAAGAVYSYKRADQSAWIKVYDSAYTTSDTELRKGMVVYNGTVSMDNFRETTAGSTSSYTLYKGIGVFDVNLTVIDRAGQSHTDTTAVTISDGADPVANAGANQTIDETGASSGTWTVSFDATGSSDDNGIYTYEWDWAYDGSTFNPSGDTGVTASHTWSSIGTYTVALRVTDHAFQTHVSTTTVTITKGNKPTADTGGPYTVDEETGEAFEGGWSVTLDGSGSVDDETSIAKYLWNLGMDTFTGTSLTQGKWYYSSQVTQDDAVTIVSATSTWGARYLCSKDIFIRGKGMAFEAKVNQVSSGNTMLGFKNTNTTNFAYTQMPYAIYFNGTQIYIYESGSSRGATGQTISFDQWYDVRIELKETQGAIYYYRVSGDSDWILLYDSNYGTDTELRRHFDVHTGTLKIDDLKEIAVGVSPTYRFYSLGSHPISLTVWDQASQTDTDLSNVTIGVNDPPVADAGGDKSGDEAKAFEGTWTFTFDGSDSTDDFGIYRYDWDWDDDGVYDDTGVSVSHTFSSPGTHTVHLRVTDHALQSVIDTADVTLTTGEAPIADAGSDITTEGHWPVYFNGGKSSDDLGIAKYSWDFGDYVDFVNHDGPTSQGVGKTPRHLYWENGDYTVTLTVYDNAMQSDTATATVHVITGDPPVANAGGPYTAGAGGPPAYFNGSSSTDDYGIVKYLWDVDDTVDSDGDGTFDNDADVVGRKPFYTYATAGTYTVTLTVVDGAGQSSAVSTATVNVADNLAPNVICVPWLAGDPTTPHETYNGRSIRLKAIVRDAGDLEYRWVFGDGTFYPADGSSWAAVTNKYIIEAGHTYPDSADETPYVATLHVKDASGAIGFDSYYVIVKPDNLDTRTNIAIDEGLWWQHKKQNKSTGAFYAPSYANYSSITGSAIQAFEINGHFQEGDNQENPYVESVNKGFEYLFTRLRSVATSTASYKTHGEPDSNGNEIGIEDNYTQPIYQGGMIMDAIASSNNPLGFATTGGTNVKGRFYFHILTDMVDMYAYGQVDSGGYRGGWRYGWHSGADNSACQWAAIGMLAAEDTFGINVPEFVKTENNIWLDYSYDGTGFGYTGSGNGVATTPSGMVQLAFSDKYTTDPRWRTAEDYIANNWFWQNNNYYGIYALVKALRLARPYPVTTLQATGLDWFNDGTTGVKKRLVDAQGISGDNWGSWDSAGHGDRGYDTAWAIIMLTPSLFVQPPVADAGDNVIWAYDTELVFDASGSFHMDGSRTIVKYEWDFNGDGVYDFTTTNPADPNARYTYADPNPTEPGDVPQHFTVRLRVTDDNEPPQTDIDTREVEAAEPPHAPFARHGGPYIATAGIPFVLDGSRSFDVDSGDSITLLMWDLDNDGDWFNDIDLETVKKKDLYTYSTPGVYQIGLKVRDNGVFNPVGCTPGETCTPLVSIPVYTMVTVYANLPPVADAGGPYVIDEGAVLTLDGSGSSDPNGDSISLAWDLDNDGDFDDSTSDTPSFSWSDNGTYTVRLKVTDSLAVTIDEKTVTVNDKGPTAGFTLTPESQPEGLSVSFTDTSVSSPDIITAWEWDFGGLGTSTAQSPVFAFNDNGTYLVKLTVTDEDGSTDSISHTVTITDKAPIAAVSGPVTLGDQVSGTYSAAGSISSPDTIVSYEWDWNYNGNTFTPSGNAGVSFAHVWLVSGSHKVAVRVTDDDGSVDIATLTVTVSDNAPTAAVSGPLTLDEGDPGTYDASGSTSSPDTIVSYEWDWNYNGNTFTPSGDTGVSFAHTWLVSGSHIVAVRVTDDDGSVDIATLAVTVNDKEPVAHLSGPATLDERESGTYDASLSTSSPNAIVSYEWDWNYNGNTFTPSGNTGVRFAHTWDDNGSYIVAVRVTDDDGSVVATMAVTVNNVNANPELAKNNPLTVDENESGTITSAHLQLIDIDQDPITYQMAMKPGCGELQKKGSLLLIGNTFTQADIDANLITYTHTQNDCTKDSFSFIASDGQGGTLDLTTFNIVINIINPPPVAYDDPDKTTEEDTAFTGDLSLFASEDAISFGIVRSPNKGRVSLNTGTGAYTYTPNANINGLDSFVFRVRDDGGSYSNNATVSIRINPVNDAPIAHGAAVTTQVNAFKSVFLNATDPDGQDSLTYIFNAATEKNGTLTGSPPNLMYQPPADFIGTDTVSFKANDGTVDSNTAVITITVQGEPIPNETPVALADTFTTAEDKSFNGSLTGTDTDGDALTFKIVSNPSKGTVQITNAATGDFTYTPRPNVNGTDSFSFKVNDGKVDSLAAIVTIIIAPANDVPVISGTPAITARLDVLYSFKPTVSNPDGDTLVFSIASQPSWAVFSAATGLLSGTPKQADVGMTFKTIVISVSDGIDTVSLAPFDLTVLGSVPATQITPVPGIYNTDLDLTLILLDDNTGGQSATYYTLDGTVPTQTSSVYDAPVHITGSTTIRYFSKNDNGAEPVQTAVYTIDKLSPLLSNINIVKPANADGVKVEDFSTVQGTAVDLESGIATVEIKVTNGTVFLGETTVSNTRQPVLTSTETWVKAVLSGANAWSYNTSGITWPPGGYTITARVTDKAGNSSLYTRFFTYIDESVLAYTELSMDLSSHTILLDGSLDILGQLFRLPDIGLDMAGQNITLTIKAPDGSEVTLQTETYDENGNYLFENVQGFDQEGQYLITARFDGIDNVFAASSASDTLLVGDSAGYAILIEGKRGDAGLLSYNLTANRIYEHLLRRGFLKDNIQYFNHDPATQPWVNEKPTKDRVKWAIDTWVAEKMNGSPAPLYLIFVDHGDIETLYLDDDVTIAPDELAQWLGSLERSLVPAALEEKRIVILGSCYSGSFIPALSGKDRVIVTSSAEEEESYKGPLEGIDPINQEPIRVGEFFLEELFTELGQGNSLQGSFKSASHKTKVFTRRGSKGGSSRFFDNAMQHPLLDDNADGIGSSKVSTGDSDGSVSQGVYLGIGSDYDPFSDLQPADIRSLTSTIYLSAWQSSALLWGNVSDNSKVSSAWVEIRDPGKTLTSAGGTGQLVNDLPKLLMALSSGDRWETTYDSFIQSGKYEAFYYVRDLATDTISPMQRSVFYKNKFGNSAPQAFSLISPLSTQEAVSTVLAFDWQNAIDPDGDPVSYNLIIASDSGFKHIVFKTTELDGASTYVDASAGLSDHTTYYWKVEAVDAYGAVTPCTQAKSFQTNDDQGIPGIITGFVYSTEDYRILPGAVVTEGVSGRKATVKLDGSFVLAVPQGTARLACTLEGYEDTPVLDVAVKSGKVTNLTIGMTPNGYLATDAVYTINEDEPLDGTLTAFTPDGTSIVFEVVDQPLTGSLAIEADGQFVYTPGPNIHGKDSFTFRVKDGAIISNTATVTLYVEAVNDAPVLGTTYTQSLPAIAQDNQNSNGITIVELIKLSVTDPDLNAVKGIAITGTTAAIGIWQYSLDAGITWNDTGSLDTGAILLSASNATRIRFTPTAAGTASLTFRAWDRTFGISGDTGVDVTSHGGTTAFSETTGTVTIQVLPINHKPVALPVSLEISEDNSGVGQLAGSDVDQQDSLTFRIVTQPAKGDAWLIDNKTGVFQYTPNLNASGNDSFTFKVNDGRADSEPAVVTITILPGNDVPIAQNAQFTAYVGVPITFSLPASDPDNDPLTFRVLDSPGNGGVYLIKGKATYTARTIGQENSLTDNFTFVANDGQQDSNIAMVIIQVNGVNTAPLSQDSTFTLEEDTSLSGMLTGTDADGDVLDFSIVKNPGKGSVKITNRGTGSFFYTPHANAFGQDSFQYKVYDGTDASAVATVSLTITGVNDPPVITGSPAAYAVSGVAYSAVATATDSDNDALTFSVQNKPSWLELTSDANHATLSGTPGATDTGIYRGIVISVTDGTYFTSLPGFDLMVVGDDTAPVTWSSLAEGAYNASQTINLTCNDLLAIIYYTLDGTEPTDASDHFTGTGSISIESSTELKFFARDADSNNEAVRTVSYTIDKTPPEIAITDPVNDTTVEQLIWIKGSASDQGSNIARVELQITNGSQFINANGQYTGSPVWLGAAYNTKTGDWEYYPGHNQWQTDVTYSITARATDAAGNQTITSSLFVYSQAAGLQALTRLTMELSQQAILQDQTVSVTGKFSRLPDTSINLSGRRIDLNVKNPAGTIVAAYHADTYDQYGHYRFNTVGGFTARGEYSLTVSFAETPLLTSSSAAATVQVKTGSGYAILIQGVPTDAQGFAAYAKNAGQIYNTLKGKGFSDASIYYLTHENNAGDDIPTTEKIQQAIETWAKNKIETAVAPLYVIMVGHGTHSAFYVNGADTISPAQLNSWLNNLRAGLDTAAAKEPQIIVMGSNGSGSFIPALSAPDRVVITSCDAGEMAVKGPLETDGRTSDLFLEEFFKAVGTGSSMKDSFSTAAGIIKIYTRKDNSYADDSIQHPLLDDNADGRGSNRLVYGNGDGEISGQMYVGTGTAGIPIKILGVTDVHYLGLEQLSADLWMKADVDNQAEAWVEIRSPLVNLNPQTGSEHRTIDLVRQPMTYGELMDQWNVTFNGFDESGKYELFHYVKKPGANTFFSMKRSVVYKNKYGNTPPGAFALLAPSDGSEHTTMPVFDWQAAVDPEGDKVTYNLIIATDVNFHNIVLRKEELTFAPVRIEDPFALKDLSRYYWKIEAVDEFGSVTYSNPWQFHTDNTNGFPAYILGQVINRSDLKGIVDAAISYDGTSFGVSKYHPAKIGVYFVIYETGTFDLTVNAAGFEESVQRIKGIELGTTEHDVYLTPATGNNAPVISGIKDQTIFENSATGAISFTIGDIETPIDQLVMAKETSNPGLIPMDGIVISGTGANRTVTLTPLPNKSGKADITIKVTDTDTLFTTQTFVLTVKSILVKGDLNRDGNVDLEDARIGLKALTIQTNAADVATDVDGDGKITMKDVMYIIQQTQK